VERRLGRSQSQSGSGGKEKISQSSLGIEYPIELYRLLLLKNLVTKP
jgi:hypothetical protein